MTTEDDAEYWWSSATCIYRTVQDGEPWQEEEHTETIATFHEPNAAANCKRVMLATDYHDKFVAALLAFITAYQPGVSPELDKAHHDAVMAISDMQNGVKY